MNCVVIIDCFISIFISELSTFSLTSKIRKKSIKTIGRHILYEYCRPVYKAGQMFLQYSGP